MFLLKLQTYELNYKRLILSVFTVLTYLTQVHNTPQSWVKWYRRNLRTRTASPPGRRLRGHWKQKRGQHHDIMNSSATTMVTFHVNPGESFHNHQSTLRAWQQQMLVLILFPVTVPVLILPKLCTLLFFYRDLEGRKELWFKPKNKIKRIID